MLVMLLKTLVALLDQLVHCYGLNRQCKHLDNKIGIKIHDPAQMMHPMITSAKE